MNKNHRMKLAVGVVTYNPSPEEISHILTYVEKVEKVYIYDNSSNDRWNKSILEEYQSKIELIANGDNDGISIAFNQIFLFAQSDNIDFVLMLDQDSKLANNYFSVLNKKIEKYPYVKFFCSNVILNKKNYFGKSSSEYTDLKFTITSGSIISVDFFLNLGGYDENLFIDGIDRDFCIRAVSNGEIIRRLNGCLLYQELGIGRKNLFGIYEHNAYRNYYIYRNRLYVLSKYPDYFSGWNKFRSFWMSELKQIFSVILFEKSKKKKLENILKAKKDYKNNKFGKFEE